jgi:micrococcal nuclease
MAREPLDFVDHPISYSQAVERGGYRGVVQQVIDGDTIDILLDLGFFDYKYAAIRLNNVDAPEIHGVKKESDEYAAGMEAKETVEELALGQHCMVFSDLKRSFNRYIGRVVIKYDGAWLFIGDILVDEGLAERVEY